MAWREPRIWVDGPHITAAQMNQVSENLRETAPAKAEAAGDIFYATGRNEIARLALGSQGQFLVPGASAPQWASVPTPITTEGDLVVGGTGGAPERLGTAGGNRIFVARGQAVGWEASGFLGGSPITTQGDLVVGDNSGDPVRLGTAGGNRIFTARGQALAWEANGFLGGSPITTRGDLAIGNASGDPTRLARGANGTVLSSNGTDISWYDPRSAGSSVFTSSQENVTAYASYHNFGRTTIVMVIEPSARVSVNISEGVGAENQITLGTISKVKARPSSNLFVSRIIDGNINRLQPYYGTSGSGLSEIYWMNTDTMTTEVVNGGSSRTRVEINSNGDINLVIRYIARPQFGDSVTAVIEGVFTVSFPSQI